MSARDDFRNLFRDPEAERELGMLGHHLALPTFNLSTSSLRHLAKWYDRLQRIADGEYKAHPNYIGDPASLGLVRSGAREARLTPAGEAFLGTRAATAGNSARAEYALVKVLFFSNFAHTARTVEFLNNKRQNLIRFLSDCQVTPSTKLLLEIPQLLAVAESVAGFRGALRSFLQLPQTSLRELAALSDPRFQALWPLASPPNGLGRLATKIGGDFRRASERRLHFIIANLLLELRRQLIQQGLLYRRLEIPYPYANLVGEKQLLDLHSLYTDDVRIAEENGEIVIFLNPNTARLPATVVTAINFGLRTPGTRSGGGRSAPTGRVRTPAPARRILESALAREAEDYVQRVKLNPQFGHSLVRVGHTDREQVALADGLTPGADFYVKGGTDREGLRFVEIKSTLNSRPTQITITRAEYKRAVKCHENNIPYELYVVSFAVDRAEPQLYHMADFSSKAATLGFQDLSSFEVTIDLNM